MHFVLSYSAKISTKMHAKKRIQDKTETHCHSNPSTMFLDFPSVFALENL